MPRNDWTLDIERVKIGTVKALFADDAGFGRFVLKGGAALDLIYRFPFARSSLDIDLSMADDLAPGEPDVLRETWHRALDREFEPFGARVFDMTFERRPKKRDARQLEFWGGYRLEFKLTLRDPSAESARWLEEARRSAVVVGRNQLRTMSVDVSSHEYCSSHLEKELDGVLIAVYSPDAIVAEKLRALCQQLPEYPHISPRLKRARARDVFDICGAIDSGLVDRVNLAMIVPEVFRAKRVDPGLLVRLRDDFARSFHAPDFRSVVQTVRTPENLRSFDEYYDRVLDLVSRLEIPGNP